jgi:hypothetical protein
LSDDILSQINVVDDWIYFATYEENDQGIIQEMYKMKTDGNGRTKITNDKVGEMNVVGDWIIILNNMLAILIEEAPLLLFL